MLFASLKPSSKPSSLELPSRSITSYHDHAFSFHHAHANKYTQISPIHYTSYLLLDSAGPEGLVVKQDGMILFAGQDTNRVARFAWDTK